MARLENVTPRLYQETILATTARANCLVILPTGMGKTTVALMLAVQRLTQYPQSKVLILAPTKPLNEQHYQTFSRHVHDAKIALFTGDVNPEKRQDMWKDSQIIISTPQSIENDVINNRIDLKDVSLIVFDEAHRTTGNYSYTFLASNYEKKAIHERILGLTASPGSDLESIMEVCQNLHIEELEIRTEKDPDVAPYVQEVRLKHIEVPLPQEFSSALKYLKECLASKLRDAKQLGVIDTKDVSKKQLLGMLASLQGQVAQGEKNFDAFKTISLLSEALKVEHAIELLETQGGQSAYSYMERLNAESHTTKTKALQNLVRDENFKSAFIKIQQIVDKGVVHPKVPTIIGLVDEALENDAKAKIIIFTNFRETGTLLSKKIELVPKAKVKQFVGQAKKGATGLSQKEQKAMLEEFRDGRFNVLVATSVAEEGLDIPQVNAVIFYEPIPSAIRSIQRRGRTGRLEYGEVKVLVTKGTRDEGYRWSAHHKEKRMYRVLDELKKKLKFTKKKEQEQPLQKFDKPFHIFVDDREKSSQIVKELMDMGMQLHLQRLDSGDYLLSSRVGVEFKTSEDFVQSLIDGRLLEQMRDLKNSYEKPLVIVEGAQDIYSVRNVHPNAIRGMLSMITISYGIPILYTKNPKDTAGMLAMIARREQDESTQTYLPKVNGKNSDSLGKQQEVVISALPGIGPTLAVPLLQRFGSVKGVVNASHDELQQVDLIGKKKAEEIRKLLDSGYGL